jgi:ABC-type transporter Mla subunit MlaD
MRGINYEKKLVMYLFIGVCLFMFAGCCTCGRINADTKDIIAGNSRASGKIEATITALDGTVTNSRDRIANIIETSRGITDGVERVEYLFNEYESEVERLLNEIDRIRNEAEIQSEDNSNSGGNSTDFHIDTNYFIDSKNQVWDKDSLLAESSTIADKMNR